MFLRYFTLVYLFASLINSSYSQRHCATDALQEQQKITNPSLYKLQEEYKKNLEQLINQKKASRLSGINDIYTIPVVVHVIYNNSSSNISDAQIHSQIEVLNEDFRKKAGTAGHNTDPVGADVNIEFCLASSDPSGLFTSGINRVFNSNTNWDPISNDSEIKSLSHWPSERYLNISVCQLGNGYLGAAHYPSGAAVDGISSIGSSELDGVIIDYRAFGRIGTAGNAPHALYPLGRTTTHEIGHWLGLIHIWGQGFACGTDYVSDTPTDAGPNDDSDCVDSSDCDGNTIYTLDMTTNYLDYSPDACMNLFTEGQKLRMRTVMETAPRRVSLLSSTGCCATGAYTALPFIEDFESSSSHFISKNPDLGSPEWSINNSGGFGESFQSIVIDNDISLAGQADSLESVYIEFKNSKPVLEFDLAYAKNISSLTDSLVLSYSLNCFTWTPFYSLYGSSLATTNRITDDFIPQASEWKKIRIDLNILDNKPVGRIRFENYSKAVNKLYLDNINIYNTPQRLKITPYPNPTNGILKVFVELPEFENVKFELFDMLGQAVFIETDLQKSQYIKHLDFTSLSRGLYILKVSTRNDKATKRILLF
jgi:hypothetical protein